MMHGPEKSDPVIVAGKPTNKAERSAAELVEPRTGTKGNADRQSTHWTQSQARVSQALERIRQAVAVTHPRGGPHAGKPPVRICAGGARQLESLPLSASTYQTIQQKSLRIKNAVLFSLKNPSCNSNPCRFALRGQPFNRPKSHGRGRYCTI